MDSKDANQTADNIGMRIPATRSAARLALDVHKDDVYRYFCPSRRPSERGTTLNDADTSPGSLAWVFVHPEGHPDWQSKKILHCKSGLNLLPGYCEREDMFDNPSAVDHALAAAMDGPDIEVFDTDNNICGLIPLSMTRTSETDNRVPEARTIRPVLWSPAGEDRKPIAVFHVLDDEPGTATRMYRFLGWAHIVSIKDFPKFSVALERMLVRRKLIAQSGHLGRDASVKQRAQAFQRGQGNRQARGGMPMRAGYRSFQRHWAKITFAPILTGSEGCPLPPQIEVRDDYDHVDRKDPSAPNRHVPAGRQIISGTADVKIPEAADLATSEKQTIADKNARHDVCQTQEKETELSMSMDALVTRVPVASQDDAEDAASDEETVIWRGSLDTGATATKETDPMCADEKTPADTVFDGKALSRAENLSSQETSETALSMRTRKV